MSVQAWSVTRFALSSPSVPGAIDVELRRVGERWIAVAVTRCGRGIGVAAAPGDALAAALAWVGEPARTELLADPALLGPSCEIAVVMAAGA